MKAHTLSRHFRALQIVFFGSGSAPGQSPQAVSQTPYFFESGGFIFWCESTENSLKSEYSLVNR